MGSTTVDSSLTTADVTTASASMDNVSIQNNGVAVWCYIVNLEFTPTQ